VSVRGYKMVDRESWMEVGESYSEDGRVILRSDGNWEESGWKDN
jgi:hypothetical protein